VKIRQKWDFRYSFHSFRRSDFRSSDELKRHWFSMFFLVAFRRSDFRSCDLFPLFNICYCQNARKLTFYFRGLKHIATSAQKRFKVLTLFFPIIDLVGIFQSNLNPGHVLLNVKSERSTNWTVIHRPKLFCL
jgi:hypothetical protein